MQLYYCTPSSRTPYALLCTKNYEILVSLSPNHELMFHAFSSLSLSFWSLTVWLGFEPIVQSDAGGGGGDTRLEMHRAHQQQQQKKRENILIALIVGDFFFILAIINGIATRALCYKNCAP